MKAKLAKKLVSCLVVSGVLVVVFAACDLGLTPYVAATDSGPEPIVDAGNRAVDTGTVDAGSDAGDAGDAGAGPKRVFVTSSKVTGSFGGQAGADAVCAALGMSKLGSARFVAWVSETNKDAIDHITDVGPWYLVDQKTLVLANKAAIAPAGPALSINLDETGATVAASEHVWTGTLINGRVGNGPNASCTEWTQAPIAGNLMGISGTISLGQTGDWTQAYSELCFTSNHLYCFEQ